MKHFDRSRDIGDLPVVTKEKFLSSAIQMAKEHQEPPIYREGCRFQFSIHWGCYSMLFATSHLHG